MSETRSPERVAFAEQIADSVESFLIALRAIARDATPGQAVSLLLLEISQVLQSVDRLLYQSKASRSSAGASPAV